MRNIIFILFITFFCSCEGTKSNQILDFKIVDVLEVIPEVMLSPNPAQIRLIESDSGRFIFVLSHISKNFNIFNLENGKLVKEIILDYDGPNSVRNFTGVGNLENNRIWLTFSPHAIGYTDFDGNLLFKRSIKLDLIDITVVYSNFYQSLYLYRNKVFGMQPLFMGHHKMSESDIMRHPLVYSFDLILNKEKWYDVFYSQNYWSKGKKLSNFSWARRENKLYISPWYDHEIQVFNMETEVVEEKVIAKSDKINNFYYVNEIPGSNEEGLRNRIKHDLYGILLYDKYRDCFYRFFFPGYEDDEQYSMEDLWRLDRSRPYTGIMVLDKDLNVVGEFVFEKFQIHATSNMFVGERGLYLSLNNENSPDFNEESLRYLVVQFDKQE